jgi:hypothetical protein
LPAGHQIDAKAAAGDGVDGGGHARDDRRGQREGGGGGVDLDPRGDRGQPGHQGEGLQVVIPEFGFAAEAAQLDHRKRKVEMVVLRFLHDGLIQLKGRHVLRGMVEISQPLLPMGTNTPIFITNLSSLRRRCNGVFAKAVPVLKMALLLMC